MKKQRFELAIIGVLVAMISGVPSTLSVALADDAVSPAKKRLAKIVEDSRTGVAAKMLALHQKFQAAQKADKIDYGPLTAAAKAAFAAMKDVKGDIESAAASIVKEDEETAAFFLTILTSYYGFRGLLETVASAFGGAAGVDAGDVASLDIIVSKTLADTVAKFMGQKSVRQGADVFEIPFSFSDAGAGKRRIVLSAREANRFRQGAFIAFPSEKTAKNELVWEALKLVFVKLAHINSFLYPDQRVEAKLPAKADPALVALQTQANGIVREGAYRKYVTKGLVKDLAASVVATRQKFVDETVNFFAEIALTFGQYLDLKTVDQWGGIPGIVAVYLESFEPEKRVDYLSQGILNNATYLSMLSKEELRTAITEAGQFAYVAMVAGILEQIGIGGTDHQGKPKLTERDMAILSVRLTAFGQRAFPAEAVTDAVLAPFLDAHKQAEVIASYRRYELAAKALAGVELLENMNKALGRIKDAKVVPEELLRTLSPDAGQVVMSMKKSEELPAWFFEVFESVMAKVRFVKSQSDQDALLAVMSGTPKRVREITTALRSNATGDALKEILAAHNEKYKDRKYRWYSFEYKLQALARAVESYEAKTLLGNILEGLTLSQKIGSGGLTKKLRGAFDILLGREFERTDLAMEMADGLLDKGLIKTGGLIENFKSTFLDKLLEGVTELQTEADRVSGWVSSHMTFLQVMVGSNKATRLAHLRSILTDPEVYRSYVGIHVQDIQMSLPLLFTAIPVATDLRAAKNVHKPVKFGDLVTKIKRAMDKGALDQVVGVALKQLKSETVRDVTKFEDKLGGMVTISADGVEHDFTPRSVMSAAIDGTTQEVEFLDAAIDKTVEYFSGGKTVAPTSDSHWPKQFLVRDAIPAFTDKAPMDVRARRLIVATLIEPYLRSAAAAAKDEQTMLLDPSIDNTKALAQSEAYRLLSNETGKETGEGLSELQAKATKWRRRWEAVKKVSTVTQEYAGHVFHMVFIFDKSVKVGGGIGFIYMLASAMIDYTAEVGLLVDYTHTYSEMRPFGQSGALGKATISQHQLEQVYDEMHTMTKQVLDRSAMDLAFFGSAAHGGMMAWRQWRFTKRLKAAGFTIEEFSNDHARLKFIYDKVGLGHLASPEAFGAAYALKVKELTPKLETDAKAKEEFARWVVAAKVTAEFNSKYEAVFSGGTKPDVAPKDEPAPATKKSEQNKAEREAKAKAEAQRKSKRDMQKESRRKNRSK